MALNCLHDYTRILKEKDALREISCPGDTQFEITEIADRVMKQPGGGKALLFKNTGTDFPLLINGWGSEDRMKTVFGGREPKKAIGEFLKILDKAQQNSGLIGRLQLLKSLRPYLKIQPKKIQGNAPCQEVVAQKPNLGKLPVLQTWPQDGGPFITLPMVITQDPDTRQRNIGMYRMQIFDAQTTGMHWHIHKGGAAHFEKYKTRKQKMPVAVVLGGDPLLTYAATAPLPQNIDELLLAGFIRQKPVKLVKAISQDIMLPADSDIVIEGYIDPDEDWQAEGPFGDHTGFYSLQDRYPRMHVTCITHRQNAVYPATIVGVPPMEDAWFATATESFFLPLIQKVMAPELLDMHMTVGGVAHNLVLAKMRKEYPAQPVKLMHSLLGSGQLMFSKVLLTLNEAVDIRNEGDVLSVLLQAKPERDIMTSHGPVDVLEHASRKALQGGKLLIDLTEYTPGKLPDLQKKDTRNGVFVSTFLIGPCLIGTGKDALSEYANKTQFENLHEEGIAYVLLIEHEKMLKHPMHLQWWVLANLDPARDILIQDGILWIDGRHAGSSDKSGSKWPDPVISDKATIRRVDEKWQEYGIGECISSPSLITEEFVK